MNILYEARAEIRLGIKIRNRGMQLAEHPPKFTQIPAQQLIYLIHPF